MDNMRDRFLLRLFMMLLLSLFVGAAGYAQDCYNSTRADGVKLLAQGKTFFNQGKKEEAKRQISIAREHFKAAQLCPDKPENNDLKSLISETTLLIQKCDGITPTCVVKKFYFSESGTLPASVPYQVDRMAALAPMLLIESGNISSKQSEIAILITDPSGAKLTNGAERTATVSQVLYDGDNTVSFTKMGNITQKFKPGTYSVEVWWNSKSVYLDSFIVEKAQKKPDAAVPSQKEESVVGLVPEKFEDKVTLKTEAGFVFGFFSVKSAGVISSVMDYGITDVPSLAEYERPNYTSKGGFAVSVLADVALSDILFVETGVSFRHIAVRNFFSCDRVLYQNTYLLDYGCVEKYRMNNFDIPVLAGCKIPVADNCAISFTTGPVFTVGLSAKCKLTEGYSNYETVDGLYYAKSDFSGTVNLYSGQYDIEQTYSTGSSPHHNYSGTAVNPLKRMGLGWDFGAAFMYGKCEVAMKYVLGLNNAANQNYWSSTNRISGLLIAGTPIKSSARIASYRQRVNYLNFSFRYYFK